MTLDAPLCPPFLLLSCYFIHRLITLEFLQRTPLPVIAVFVELLRSIEPAYERFHPIERPDRALRVGLRIRQSAINAAANLPRFRDTRRARDHLFRSCRGRRRRHGACIRRRLSRPHAGFVRMRSGLLDARALGPAHALCSLGIPVRRRAGGGPRLSAFLHTGHLQHRARTLVPNCQLQRQRGVVHVGGSALLCGCLQVHCHRGCISGASVHRNSLQSHLLARHARSLQRLPPRHRPDRGALPVPCRHRRLSGSRHPRRDEVASDSFRGSWDFALSPSCQIRCATHGCTTSTAASGMCPGPHSSPALRFTCSIPAIPQTLRLLRPLRFVHPVLLCAISCPRSSRS